MFSRTASLIVIGVTMLLPYGCGPSESKCRLELEVFYRVFDFGLVPGAKVRWATIALKGDECAGFTFGDSVVITFVNVDGKLQPSAVHEFDPAVKSPMSLRGEYIGVRPQDSLCRIGFELRVSPDEFEQTKYTKGTTLTISANFVAGVDSTLVFKSLEVVGRQPREPIRFK